ncbi:MAG: hypothetical protein ACR5K2_01935 [Wolbachia sp.]
MNENVNIRKNLKQDAPKIATQGTEPESSKSYTKDVDWLNVENAQDREFEGVINKKEPQYYECKAPAAKSYW